MEKQKGSHPASSAGLAFPDHAVAIDASHAAQAAVDGKRLGGDVDALVRQKEQHGTGDFPCRRLAAERDAGLAA